MTQHREVLDSDQLPARRGLNPREYLADCTGSPALHENRSDQRATPGPLETLNSGDELKNFCELPL